MKPHSNCAKLVAVIEEFLDWRHDGRERRRNETPYTREDFMQRAYSGYHDMLYGRIKRPPERRVILHIAEYFRTSALGRDRLLVAAGYLPVMHVPDAKTEALLLRQATDLLPGWPFPAVVLSRDWTISDWNRRFLEVWALPEAEWLALAAERRNVLNLAFDPSLPLARQMTPAARLSLARHCLEAFWQSHLLAQAEPWFGHRLNLLKPLPNFIRCQEELNFKESGVADPEDGAWPSFLSLRLEQVDRPIRMRAVVTPIHASGYPAIVSFIESHVASNL